MLSRDVGNDERRVARGEFPMRIPQLFSNWLALKSLPVKFVAPDEGLPYIRFDFGVLNGAPHPNAARLFINHYLSEQVQTAYAVAGLMPVVDGILDKARRGGRRAEGHQAARHHRCRPAGCDARPRQAALSVIRA